MERVKHQFLSSSESLSKSSGRSLEPIWVIPYEEEKFQRLYINIARELNPEYAIFSFQIENFSDVYNQLTKEEIPEHLATVKRLTNKFTDFIIQASDEYKFSTGSLIGLSGFSGATCIGSIMLQNPGLIKRAIIFDPLLPFIPRVFPDLSGAEILMIAGKRTPDETKDIKDLAKTLINSNAAVEVSLDDKSVFGEKQVAACKKWLERVEA